MKEMKEKYFLCIICIKVCIICIKYTHTLHILYIQLHIINFFFIFGFPTIKNRIIPRKEFSKLEPGVTCVHPGHQGSSNNIKMDYEYCLPCNKPGTPMTSTHDMWRMHIPLTPIPLTCPSFSLFLHQLDCFILLEHYTVKNTSGFLYTFWLFDSIYLFLFHFF
jgi:hypothetical protein